MLRMLHLTPPARPARAPRGPALRSVLAMLLVALTLNACAGKRNKIPPGTSEPDKFLFERGTQTLNERKWLTAREFFQTLIDTYPQSQYRADAKLGLGDSYLGDGSLAAQVLAINEFREFLSFFPTHARADYAQYKLGMAHYDSDGQGREGPDRDPRSHQGVRGLLRTVSE